jgi:rare lipoprotein A
MKLQCLFLAILFFIPLGTFAQYKKVSQGVWEGTASYYHKKFNGRMTANGEIFSNKNMTAANNFLKLGTWVRVTNLANGNSVIVKINDRMNKRNKRLIDMSRAAADQLGYINAGLGQVKMEVLHNHEGNKNTKPKKKKRKIIEEEPAQLDSTSLATVYKFPAWAKIILNYEGEVKIKKKYVSGALYGKQVANEYKTRTFAIEGGQSYKLVLLSRQASTLKSMNIVPYDAASKKMAGERNYAMISSKTKKDHFIFHFNYQVPAGTNELQFDWEAILNAEQSDEDFALFILEE